MEALKRVRRSLHQGNFAMRMWKDRGREVLRFLQVGVASNVAYFLMLALLHLYLRLALWQAASVAYAASMGVNYVLHHRHTFRSTERHSAAMVRYLILHVSMLAVNSLVLHLLVTVAGGRYWVSQAIAIGVVTVLTYLLGREWVFSSKAAGESGPTYQSKKQGAR